MGVMPLVLWNQVVSSMVAGEDVREMELEKLAQDPGEDVSRMAASGPYCICDGTTCRGLASANEKLLQSVLMGYPFQ